MYLILVEPSIIPSIVKAPRTNPYPARDGTSPTTLTATFRRTRCVWHLAIRQWKPFGFRFSWTFYSAAMPNPEFLFDQHASYVVCIIDAGNSSSANSSQEFHFASPKDSLHQAWLLLAALALFIACVASSSGCQFISWLKTTWSCKWSFETRTLWT